MVACLLAAVLAAAPPKLVVLELGNGEGVPASTAQALTEAVVAEVRRASQSEVVTQREIASVLSLEKQKEMLGCATDACMAEFGGALGADRLVAGDMAKLGESFLLHLRVVDVKKVRVAAQADRRLRGGTIDDVLDVLPAMVRELFPGSPPAAALAAPPPAPQVAPAALPQPPLAAVPAAAAAPTTQPAVAASPPPAVPAPVALAEPPQPSPVRPAALAAPLSAMLAAWVEAPENVTKDLRERLMVLTDDAGLFIALVPFEGIDAPLWAGDGERLFRQRIVGGGREGRLAFGRVFWDPRARVGAEASLDMRGGRGVLTCGKRKIPLRIMGLPGTRRVLASARFFEPPFRRIPRLLARDELGSYYLVDAARNAATGAAEERPYFRLRYGKKGALYPVEVSEAIADRSGLALVTPTGRLVERGGAIEWVTGAGRTPLTPLDLRDSGPFIYGELGAYGGRLGTPCDGKFP